MYEIIATMNGRNEYIKCENEHAARQVLYALTSVGYHCTLWHGMTQIGGGNAHRHAPA